MDIITKWLRHYLSDPQVVFFLFFLAIIILVIMTLGQVLTPVIAGLVLAYLLEGLVRPLECRRMPRILAVNIVFIIFLLAFFFLMLGLVPLMTRQIAQFLQELPNMITSWQEQLLLLPEKYPELINQEQVNTIIDTIGTQVGRLGKNVLSLSIASVRGLINAVIYMVLVPIMVYFFLKDKDKIMGFVIKFLPQKRDLANTVWKEVNQKTAKFIQGKIWEIFIVWVVSYISFLILGLKFALLLSFLVGISVIVPYVGATVMTIPVALVAYFQWGWDAHFAYVIITYIIIQILDGNLLVPLLLSEIVKLHPLAIIVGILVFGGIWGFWGVFFAIPLATLVNAVINAWPQRHEAHPDHEHSSQPCQKRITHEGQ